MHAFHRRLSFGLVIGMFASSNFTSSRKVSKATDCLTGGSLCRFNVERVLFVFFPVKNVLEAHSSCEKVKVF